jgi:cyanophycinase
MKQTFLRYESIKGGKIVRSLLLLLALNAGSILAADQPLPGHLVLNGGGAKPREVMEKFIELAGGPEAGIVVFPTASGEADTGQYYRDLLQDEYGCSHVSVAEVKSRDDAMQTVIRDQVLAADGIFFSGGDQRRITRALHDTPVGDAVVAAWQRGAVIGGTSAGTACQSDLMITGDGDFTILTAGNVELWTGLGIFKGVIVDQHFVARQRQNRLISVVLEHPRLLGVGVDEGTAVWVRPDGTFKVLGTGWVMVLDAAGAEVQRSQQSDGKVALGVHSLVTHILLPGEVFDLTNRQVAGEH